MAILNFSKMLALLLVSLVALASASPIATSGGASTAAAVDCQACSVTLAAVCHNHNLSEYQCQVLWCLSLKCHTCSSRCPPGPGASAGLAGATIVDTSTDDAVTVSIDTLIANIDAAVADLSSTSLAPTTKREAAQQCVWICSHVLCHRQCIDDAEFAAYEASGSIVIDESEINIDTSISVTANHTQLENHEHVENAFLYHCDLSSGSYWTETILEPVAGTETAIENIPNIPYRVCREICNTDKSLCGLVCTRDEKEDPAVEDPVVKDPVSRGSVQCHWECYFGQCWAVCMPVGLASDSSDVSSASTAVKFRPCRWDCFFGQCWTCCPPP